MYAFIDTIGLVELCTCFQVSIASLLIFGDKKQGRFIQNFRVICYLTSEISITINPQ